MHILHVPSFFFINGTDSPQDKWLRHMNAFNKRFLNLDLQFLGLASVIQYSALDTSAF